MEINDIAPSNLNISHETDGIKKASKEFEAFFLSYMLKVMRETVPKDGLFSGGKGEEIYTSMLDESLSREMASKGGIGIGELLLMQLNTGGTVKVP